MAVQSHLDDSLPVRELQVAGVTRVAGVLNFQGPGTSSDVDSLGRPRLNIPIGGGSGAPGLIINDSAALSDELVASLPEGTAAYVRTYRDYFILRKPGQAVAAVPHRVVATADDPNAGWYRQFTPCPSWTRQTDWAIRDSGSDEAQGTLEQPLATVGEFMRRLGPNQPFIPAGELAVRVLSNLDEDIDIALNLPHGSNTGVSLHFTAFIDAAAPVSSGTISAVQAIVESTNTVYTVTATGVGWSAQVNRLGVITSGPRAGARFVVEKDLGSNVAMITKVTAGPFDPTPVTLQVGDQFEIYTPYSFGSSVAIRGSGSVSFSNLLLGSSNENPTHAVTIYEATAFFDLCHMPNGLNAERASYLEAISCSVQSGCRAQSHSEMLLTMCHVSGASPIARTGATLWSYSSHFFGQMRVESLGNFKIDTGYHAGFFDQTTAVHVDGGGRVEAKGDLWGTGVAGPRIDVRGFGSIGYASGFVPHIAGSGAEISVGGSGGATAYAGLPSSNANNLATVTVL